MSNKKSMDNIIKELCQVSNITITKAGKGESLNPSELVILTQVLDNWKDGIIETNSKYHSNIGRAIKELEYLKSQYKLSYSDNADLRELIIDLEYIE